MNIKEIEEGKNYIINIDKVKAAYAEKNPELKPLNNTDISKVLGVNKQVLTDWNTQAKKKPNMPIYLLKLAEISGLTVEEIIDYVE